MRYRLRTLVVGFAVIALLCAASRHFLPLVERWPTGRAEDMAIVGEGFFPVREQNGQNRLLFTRKGDLWIDEMGTLRFGKAELGLALDSSIAIPAGYEVSVDGDGSVFRRCASSDEPCCVGMVQIAIFRRPDLLCRIDDAFWETAEGAEIPQLANPGTYGAGYLLPGWLEYEAGHESPQLPRLSLDVVVLLLAASSLAAYCIGASGRGQMADRTA